MKAIRFDSFNDSPALKDVPVPDIGPDQVLVRVDAAALNPLDALIVSGAARHFFELEPPMTVGTDFAGTVDRIGADVTEWKVGDRVIAWADASLSGGLAEFAAVPAAACVTLPPELSAIEGAAIPTAGITAWHALFSAGRLKAGETVLIHGGAGGVGGFAVQFAHRAGAHVIATASGAGVPLVRQLGADQVVDYRSEDFTTSVSDVDVVLDLVGGDTQTRSYSVMSPGGRLVSTTMPPDASVAAAYGVTGSIFYAKPFADRLDDLVAAIVAQKIRVVIDHQGLFGTFDQAWARQTSGQARGKIVLSLA